MKYKEGDKLKHNGNSSIIIEIESIDSEKKDSHYHIKEKDYSLSEYNLDKYWDKIGGVKIKKNTNSSDLIFEDITSSICEMLKVKNKAYGESALEPLDILSKHHPYGARIDEKLARVKHSDTLRKNDVADLIGGLIILQDQDG